MARIRTIKPELAAHEGLFDLEKETGLPIRFAWCMLFTVADREGRFKWQPRTLKAQILPHDELDFSRVLDAWVTRGFVLKYCVKGVWYGWIPTFTKHQVINNRESPSDIPPFERADEVYQTLDACATRESRRAPRDADASGTCEVHAQAEGKGRKEGKGTDGRVSDACSAGAQQNATSASAEADLMLNFESVVEAYPKLTRWWDRLTTERNCQRLISDHGQTWASLRVSATAYAQHCASGGVSGPDRVMNPDKFFAVTRDGPWTHDWQPVAVNGTDPAITWRPPDDEEPLRANL